MDFFVWPIFAKSKAKKETKVAQARNNIEPRVLETMSSLSFQGQGYMRLKSFKKPIKPLLNT